MKGLGYDVNRPARDNNTIDMPGASCPAVPHRIHHSADGG